MSGNDGEEGVPREISATTPGAEAFSEIPLAGDGDEEEFPRFQVKRESMNTSNRSLTSSSHRVNRHGSVTRLQESSSSLGEAPSTPGGAGTHYQSNSTPNSTGLRRKARRRRTSIEYTGDPGAVMSPGSMGSGKPTTPHSQYSASRRKLSTKIIGRLSVFEKEEFLDVSESGFDTPHASPRPMKPVLSAQKSPQSVSSRRESKAFQIIEQFNQQSLDVSRHKNSPSGDKALLSNQEIKKLVKSATKNGRISTLIDMMGTGVPNMPDMAIDDDDEFGTDMNEKESAAPLLTPAEIKSLIKASSKKLSNIVNTYENINQERKVMNTRSIRAKFGPTTEDEETENKPNAKARRHFAKMKPKESKPKDVNDTPGKSGEVATEEPRREPRKVKKSAGVQALQTMTAGMTSRTNPMEQAIRGTTNTKEWMDYVPPKFAPEKTPDQVKLIAAMIKENFAFKEFRESGKARNDGTIDLLANAFQPVDAQPGQQVFPPLTSESVSTDDTDELDPNCFYIVQGGAVDFSIEGEVIGSAAQGECFGEQSLLHHFPTMATITASSEEPAKLLKLDQATYRGILTKEILKSDETKLNLLYSIDFLKPIFEQEQDDSLINRLASLMTREEFVKGQNFAIDEESAFHIVQSGKVLISGAGITDIKLAPCEYFGERAMVTSLKKKTTGEIYLAGLSEEGGVFYSIERADLQDALGSRLDQLQDMLAFRQSSRFQQATSRGGARIKRIVSKVSRRQFSNAGEDILKDEDPTQPNMYVIQEGTAKVSYTDSEGNVTERTYEQGEVFGDEGLDEDKTTIDGARKLKRRDGFTALTSGEDPVSVGILPINELKESRHAPAVNQQETDYIGDMVSHQLRSKIRQSVKVNVGLDDLEKISMLGEGQFGEVWLVAADVFQTGVDSLKQRFALKSQFKRDETREDATEFIRREISIMEEFNHPGIANLVNTYEDESCIHMLMGLIPGGELWNRIHVEDDEGNWTSGLSEAHAKFYTLIVADTLAYIHQKGYIFRDMKPENIMIDEDGYPVVVDFGFAKHCPDDKTFTFCGTPNYVAPEVITCSGHGRASDFWSLGIMTYEMITGENPFYYEGLDQVSLYDAICQEDYYSMGEETSDAINDLIRRLLEKDPSKRIGSQADGLKDLIEHQWFEELDLDRLRSKIEPAPWKPPSDETEMDEDAVEDLMASFSTLTTTDIVPAIGNSKSSGDFFDDILEGTDDEEESVSLDDSFGDDEGDSSLVSPQQKKQAPISLGQVIEEPDLGESASDHSMISRESASSSNVKDLEDQHDSGDEPKTKSKSIDLDLRLSNHLSHGSNHNSSRKKTGNWKQALGDSDPGNLNYEKGNLDEEELEVDGEGETGLRKTKSVGSLQVTGLAPMGVKVLARRRGRRVVQRKSEKERKKERRSTIIGALHDLGVAGTSSDEDF